MAVDREALTAALSQLANRELVYFDDDLLTVAAAARERLAQLPEKCEHGETGEHGAFRPGVPGSSWMCPGKQYPPALVERIAGAIKSRVLDSPQEYPTLAVAVLDALNTETADL